MYSNIGDKVCKVAMVCGCIGVVCAIIGFFIWAGNSFDEIGGLILAAIGVSCLLSSWPLYAFGQITNDVHAMRMSGSANASTKQFSDLPEL